MRILIISPWCDDVDIETCKGTPENAYLFTELLKRGHEIIFLCQGTEQDIPQKIRVKVNYCAVKNFPFLKPSKLNYLAFPVIHFFYERYLTKKLYEILKDSRVDIVYNIAGYGHPAILKLCKKYGIPYAVKTMGTIHFEKYAKTSIGKILYFKEHLIFKYKAGHYFLVDDGTKTYEVAKVYKIEDNTITILPNPRPTLMPPNTDTPKYTVGYFSRFDRLKGTDLFIKTAKNVIESNPKIKFLIAGDGPLKPKILELAEKFKENVKYLGFLTHFETQKVFHEIDLLVSTNRYSNMTLNVIESISHGVPVVVFDTQDTSKLVKDGVNGFLIKPFDANKMAEKIISIFENPNLLLTLRKGALESAEKIPTWEERIKIEVDKLEELNQ